MDDFLIKYEIAEYKTLRGGNLEKASSPNPKTHFARILNSFFAGGRLLMGVVVIVVVVVVVVVVVAVVAVSATTSKEVEATIPRNLKPPK